MEITLQAAQADRADPVGQDNPGDPEDLVDPEDRVQIQVNQAIRVDRADLVVPVETTLRADREVQADLVDPEDLMALAVREDQVDLVDLAVREDREMAHPDLADHKGLMGQAVLAIRVVLVAPEDLAWVARYHVEIRVA